MQNCKERRTIKIKDHSEKRYNMRLTPLIIFLISFSCASKGSGRIEAYKISNDTIIVATPKTNNMNYKDQLEATKKYYPFGNWRQSYNDGLEQYTQENCDKAKAVFDTLIANLIALGQDANEKDKAELFKTAVLSLNRLNEEIEDLIETGEREDLCELIDRVTIAAGLNPKSYANGEGIADEWRDW